MAIQKVLSWVNATSLFYTGFFLIHSYNLSSRTPCISAPMEMTCNDCGKKMKWYNADMAKGKEFDCVKFKDELFANSWKKSGAKNIDEYVAYVNKRYKLSPLYKSGN